MTPDVQQEQAMQTLIGENMTSLISSWAQTAPPYVYDAAPTHCSLCTYDVLCDYDDTRRANSRTSSTTATTTYDEEAGLADNCELFDDPADGYEHDPADYGMSLYGYRYYKPDIGRWVNRDSLGDHASVGARLRHGHAMAILRNELSQSMLIAMDDNYNISVRMQSLIESLRWYGGIKRLRAGDPSIGTHGAYPRVAHRSLKYPLALVGGVNNLSAFMNNSIVYVDTDGNIIFEAIIAGAIIYGAAQTAIGWWNYTISAQEAYSSAAHASALIEMGHIEAAQAELQNTVGAIGSGMTSVYGTQGTFAGGVPVGPTPAFSPSLYSPSLDILEAGGSITEILIGESINCPP